METRPQRDASILQLVRDLLSDIRTLLRQEVALARAEIREELGRVLVVAALAAVAAGTLAIAGLWILVAVTRAIAYLFVWPLATVYAGVGVVLGMIGLLLAAIAWRQVRALTVLPKTRATLREQAHWAGRHMHEHA
jgi:hypothetical protein